VSTPVRAYIRSLDIDAYIVGGAVRDELLGIPHEDEDFLVPGVDHATLRALLEPHGRVEDMEVHGQLVGVRLFPRDRAIRALVPAGIELTPPRLERSIGPRHRDFTIVADASVSIEQDMARRDFTVNSMARRLATSEFVDPFGGQKDLAARLLRPVSEGSFREDPLRILRGLRLVSQLGFRLAPETERLMRRDAAGLVHVSAERIGGGLAADGMGELSKLLLGRDPLTALRLARDVGALQVVLPELAPSIGYHVRSDRQPMTLDEHVFAVVDGCARSGASLAVRLAALLHDLAKPHTERTGESHALLGARIAASILRRLRYPTRLRKHVVRIVASHSFRADAVWDGPAVRRFLAEHGDELAGELVALKAADLGAKEATQAEMEGLDALRTGLEQERSRPHTLADLALGGDDLIAMGFREGPSLGKALHALLDRVLEDPSLNTRETLLGLATRMSR
jgi:putative nucleotidyltransferase with HDIG domain